MGVCVGVRLFRGMVEKHNATQQHKLDACFEVLTHLRTADSMRVLKTWVNGWATSYRYHDPTLYPCLFGCHAKPDSLDHYAQCSNLFALGKFIRGHSSDDPLIRMGLVQP